jgi:hypothetical protein
MKRSHFVGIVLLLLTALAVAEVALPVRYDDNAFAANFPSKVTEATDHGQSEGVGKVPYTSYLYSAADDETGNMYFVAHLDYDRDITYNLDEGLTASKNKMYTKVDADDRGNSTLNGLTARYALFAGDGKVSEGKFYVYEKVAFKAPRRVWLVMVIGQHPLDIVSYNKFAETVQIK